MWKLLFSIVLILFSHRSVLSKKQQLSVGIILIKNVDEPELEIIFRTAVDKIKSDTFQLFPMIRYIAYDESWRVEKAACSLISNGVLAVFGPTSNQTSGIVSSICNEFQIPHVTFTWQKNKMMFPREREQHSMTVDMYPENTFLSAGLADVVASYAWKGFTIVYNTQEDLEKIEDILEVVIVENDHHDHHVSTIKLRDEYINDIGPFMKQLKKSGDTCFVVQISPDILKEFFRWAKILRMTSEYFYYFLSDFDANIVDLDTELEGFDSNITTMSIASPYSESLAGPFKDWTSSKYRLKGKNVLRLDKIKTKFVILQDAVKLFGRTLLDLMKKPIELPDVSCTSKKKWLAGRNFVLQMRAYIIQPNEGYVSAPIHFNKHGQRNAFHSDIIQIRPTRAKLASYDTEYKINFRTVVKPSSERSELIEHKIFKVATKLGRPYLFWRNTSLDELYEGNNRYIGYSVDLINLIAQRFNTKFEIELVPENIAGVMNSETRRWNGIMGQLISRKADIGICDLTITSERRRVVDFTTPFMTLGIGILFTKANREPPNLFSFLSPFTNELWLTMGTAYLVIALLIFFLSRLSPDYRKPTRPDRPPQNVENIWRIRQATYIALGAFVGLGCDIVPRSFGTRMVLGTWWFFTLMMVNSHKANLVAFLTSSRLDSKIESYHDLAAQSKIKYGVVKDGSTMEFFNTSTDPSYKKLWSVMSQTKPSVFVKTNYEGQDRVLKSKGQYAFFMESTGIDYIVERECSLRGVGQWLDVKYYGIALPLNSPYRAFFTDAVLQLSENYDLRRLKKKWWQEDGIKEKCIKAEEEQETDTPDLGMENVGGVFLVLGTGIFIAVIIALCEFLWNLQNVAVQEKITTWEAFKAEAFFVLKFWIRQKNIHKNVESLHSRHSSKSALLKLSVFSLKSNKTL